MMGINAMQCLHDYGGAEWEFACDFRGTMCMDLLLSELGEGPWRISRFPGIPDNMPSLLYKIFKPVRPLMRARWLQRQRYDAIVLLGGDDFSGSLDWRAMAHMYLCGRRIPVVFLAQTVGPFSHRRDRLLAKLFLRKYRVIARDPWTVEYVIGELHIPAVELGADLAWIDLPRQNSAGLFEETSRRFGLEKDGYISVVVSQLWEKYAGDLETYLDCWVKIVTALLRHKALKSRKICLLPHTIGANYGDERELIRQCCETAISRPSFATGRSGRSLVSHAHAPDSRKRLFHNHRANACGSVDSPDGTPGNKSCV